MMKSIQSSIFLIISVILFSYCFAEDNIVPNEWTVKQPLVNLKRLAKKFRMDAFSSEVKESSAVVIPQYNLVLCSYPKAGTTTMKWILLALLGYEKQRICDPTNQLNVHLNDNMVLL